MASRTLTLLSQQILAESCPMCGARSGQRCTRRSANGEKGVLQPANSHLARKEKVNTRETSDLSGSPTRDDVRESWNELAEQEMQAVVNAKEAVIYDEHPAEIALQKKEDREHKIQVVLWGLRFGRTVMKMTQDQIDRSVAEMVVDSGAFNA